jgi:hypothetical protein
LLFILRFILRPVSLPAAIARNAALRGKRPYG